MEVIWKEKEFSLPFLERLNSRVLEHFSQSLNTLKTPSN